MARYRCDLCCDRHVGYAVDFCNRHKKMICKNDVDPPYFCYVWDKYGDADGNPVKIQTRWYKNGKLIKN